MQCYRATHARHSALRRCFPNRQGLLHYQFFIGDYSMPAWLELLKELADEDAGLQQAGNNVVLNRHGKEYVLEVQDMVHVGTCVRSASQAASPSIPIDQFIQHEVLGLRL